MRSFGNDKRRAEDIFPSLIPLLKDNEERTTAQKLKNSSILGFIRAAQSGDKLEVLNEL
jgi:predicted glutamine amidotransferase